MNVNRFLTGIILISILTISLCKQQLRFKRFFNEIFVRNAIKTICNPSYEPNQYVTAASKFEPVLNVSTNHSVNRIRRANSKEVIESDERSSENESSLQMEDTGWSNINEQVDMVIPMVLVHLQKLGIEHLQLPDMKESLTLNPLFITYEAGLFLSNGIVYNIAGIQRYGDAFMTYENKSFVCRFYLIINSLQFEYNFLIKLMALEGYGKVIGSLDDTIIYAELAVNVPDTKLKLKDFRVVKFSNIRVQLDQIRVIRHITGLILSPITNLFRDRITTSISDGLKDQMQMLMDDFNGEDPLELQKFTKQLLSGLIGQQVK